MMFSHPVGPSVTAGRRGAAARSPTSETRACWPPTNSSMRTDLSAADQHCLLAVEAAACAGRSDFAWTAIHGGPHPRLAPRSHPCCEEGVQPLVHPTWRQRLRLWQGRRQGRQGGGQGRQRQGQQRLTRPPRGCQPRVCPHKTTAAAAGDSPGPTGAAAAPQGPSTSSCRVPGGGSQAVSFPPGPDHG